MSQERPAVCITGMHRSGTSLAARCLEALGVSFGDPQQLMGPGPDNAVGYWENRYIKELDDELLAHLGGSWDQPPVLQPGWEHADALEPFRTRAAALIDGAFGPSIERAGLFAFKDPRLSLLLPFWRTVVPVETSIVIVRDPIEVVASLKARNLIDAPKACLLWLRYLLSARLADPGGLVLRQRDFFDRLPATLSQMAAHLGLDEPNADATDAAGAHLDPELRHHRSPSIAAERTPIVELALRVWHNGEINTTILDPTVMTALAEGWLRAPADTEALDLARSTVVELTERLRTRARARKAAAVDQHEDEP